MSEDPQRNRPQRHRRDSSAGDGGDAPGAGSSGGGHELRWHEGQVTRAMRDALNAGGCTVWLTGLSGSGKSTIAVALERALVDAGRLAYRLDGDNVRLGLNAGLGFDAAGRAEAVRRMGEAALLLADAGVVAIVAMISPYRAGRDAVRARHASRGVPFSEVFVDVPLAVAESRDPKGLYAKARGGQVAAFTGVNDPYEAPLRPDIHLRTDTSEVGACVETLLRSLKRGGGGA